MANDAELARWEAVGAKLSEARRARRLTKRAAAARAGFSEITWRNLEQGARQVAPGVMVPVSPKDETLEAAARAVDLDPGELFALAQRAYMEPIIPLPTYREQPAALSGVEIPDDLTPEEADQIRVVIDGIRARRERR